MTLGYPEPSHFEHLISVGLVIGFFIASSDRSRISKLQIDLPNRVKQ